MKDRSIRFNVTSTHPADQEKDRTWLRKVHRIAPGPGTERQKRSRRLSREDWDMPVEDRPATGGFPIAWMILLGVLFTGLIVGAVLSISPKDRSGSTSPSPVVLGGDADSEPAGPTPINETDAIALVRQALAVRDPRDVEKFMITGSATPDQIVGFLDSLATMDGSLERLDWMASMDANDLPMEGVTVFFTKDGVRRNRLALLTPDEDGGWRMDFEAFARWSIPSWKEILGDYTGQAMVRVFIAPDNYYNGEYRDDAQWLCFGLASPDVEQLMFGYCKRGTPQEKALQRILTDSGGAVRAVLKIRRGEGAESRQFEITGVLAEDWARGPQPLDER